MCPVSQSRNIQIRMPWLAHGKRCEVNWNLSADVSDWKVRLSGASTKANVTLRLRKKVESLLSAVAWSKHEPIAEVAEGLAVTYRYDIECTQAQLPPICLRSLEASEIIGSVQ